MVIKMEKCKPFPINDILLHIKCNDCLKEGWYSSPYDFCPALVDRDLQECCYFTPYLNLKKCQECSKYKDEECLCRYVENYRSSPNMCNIDAPFDECYDEPEYNSEWGWW